MEIHPALSIQGIKYDGDAEDFCRRLEMLFAMSDEKETQYVAQVCSFIRQWASDDDTVICRTSGSTGTPKEIPIDKTRMKASALMTCRYFGLWEGTRALLCLPVTFIAGKMMLVRAFTAGWKLTLKVPCSNPLDDTGDKIFDFAAFVPMQLYASAEQLQRVKKILAGGGEISRKFICDIGNKTASGCEIYQSYAMTETITHVALRMLYPQTEEEYTATEGVSFSLSKRGTLVITAPALLSFPLETNDMATLIDSTHFKWIGRTDTVINSGGVKIIPEQTEQKLADILPGRYFAAGLPDDVLGEKQVLFVEGHSGDFQHLKSFLKSNFDGIHRPKDIIFMEKFPLTHTGKTDKKKILEDFRKHM